MDIRELNFVLGRMIDDRNSRFIDRIRSRSNMVVFNACIEYLQPTLIPCMICVFVGILITHGFVALPITLLLWGVVSLISGLIVVVTFKVMDFLDYVSTIRKEYRSGNK